jgi:hypothetical protein
MKAALPWLAPLAFAPLLASGLWLWRDQATQVWLSGFLAACF